MAMEIAVLPRAFLYNSVELPDPGKNYSATQVRDLYSATYPEILNAAIEGPEEKNGKLVYTYRRAVGTKGAAKVDLVAVQVNPLAREGIKRIAAERFRQVTTKRWSTRHDDEHTDHSLARAACAYATPEPLFRLDQDEGAHHFSDCWPDGWLREYDKRPRDAGEALLTAESMTTELRVRQLEKAGALIAAEIDRLLRLKK